MTVIKLAHLLFGSFYEMSFNEAKKQVIHCVLRHSAPHSLIARHLKVNVALDHVLCTNDYYQIT